jgi:hypothetical protein
LHLAIFIVAVLTYGASGAGKSYTMFGAAKVPGLVGLAANALFDGAKSVEDRLLLDTPVKFKVSFLEVSLGIFRGLT